MTFTAHDFLEQISGLFLQAYPAGRCRVAWVIRHHLSDGVIAMERAAGQPCMMNITQEPVGVSEFRLSEAVAITCASWTDCEVSPFLWS